VRALTAIAAVVILTAACTNAKAAPTAVPTSAVTLSGDLGEQRHEAGAVTVVVSWLADPTPTARVALDTHSVDLDGFDLTQLARVRLDGGAWIPATTWDAPKGGHHRAGTLSFGSLDPQVFASARVIELEVRDVAGPSHLLRWERAR
jgi:hypothetical protein